MASPHSKKHNDAARILIPLVRSKARGNLGDVAK